MPRSTTRDRIGEFDSAMRQMNAQFQSTAQNQTSQLDSMYIGLSQADMSYKRQAMKGERDLLNSQLKLMKRNFKIYSKQMNQADKQAYQTTYRHRQKDLRRLEREARYRFEEIGDEGRDAAEEVGESWGKMGDKFKGLADSLNLNSIAEGMTDTAKTVVDSQKEITKLTGLSRKDIKAMDKSADDLIKKFDGKFSRSEVYESAGELVKAYKIKDPKVLQKLTESFVKQQKANDATIDSVKGVVEMSEKKGFSPKDMDKWGNWIRGVSNTDLKVTPDGLYDMFNATYEKIAVSHKGDKKGFDTEMRSVMALGSALEDNFSDSGQFMDILKEIRSAAPDELGELSQKYGGLDIMSLQQQLKGGDWAGAGKVMIQQVQDLVGQGGAMGDMWKQKLGGDTDNIMKIELDTYQKDVAKATKAIDESAGKDLVSKAIDDQVVNPLIKAKNMIANTGFGKAISDFMGNTGLDTTDLLLGANMLPMGKIAKGLGKGAKGIGKGLRGLWRTGGNVRAGYGLAREAGSGIGASAVQGTQMAFSGGRIATGLGRAGRFLGKVGGPLAMLSAGLDAAGGLNSSTEWLGKKRGSTAGGRASSLIGGLIGGTGPGIGDEGSGLSKGFNILGGVGKGAAAGAALGTIIPGLGTVVGGGVGAVAGGISSAIGGSNIASAIDGTMSKAGEAVKNTASSAWGSITDNANSLWESATGESWGQFKENAATAWSDVTTDAANAWDTISSSWSDLKGWFGGKVEDIKEGAGDIADSAGNAWDKFKKTTGSWWDKLWGGDDESKDDDKNVKDLDGSHKTGLDYVPFDGYRAELHKGESVLTANQARDYRSDSRASSVGSFFNKTFAGVKATAQEAMKKYWTAQQTPAGGGAAGGIASKSLGSGNAMVDGKRVNALYTGYYPANNAMEGGMLDALGARLNPDHPTVAAPPSVPFKSKIQISGTNTDRDGGIYEVRDRGGAITIQNGRYHFDILMHNEKECNDWGRRNGNATMNVKEPPKYDVGTPWVPNDQLAVVHKGEAIIPAKNNPMSSSKLGTSRATSSADMTVSQQTTEIVNVVKWAVNRLEGKLGSTGQSVAEPIPTKKKSLTDEVFSFA